MAVYLLDHPPTRDQYRSPRRARPTGLTVVHTAESVMDTVGPDTGAENVAAFIQRRTTAGSYHDLADSDSVIQLVRYGDEAYQDGTGSNPYALSISFALAAADWPRLSGQRRSAFLAQGARAFARQQAWLAANGYPTTPLRRVTRAQSEAGAAGFISHAERDPARRTDPGPGFPWDEFFTACRAGATAVLGSRIPDLTSEEDDDMYADADREVAADTQVKANAAWVTANAALEEVRALTGRLNPPTAGDTARAVWEHQHAAAGVGPAAMADIVTVGHAHAATAAVQAAIAAGNSGAILADLADALRSEGASVTDAQLDGAFRRVLGSLDNKGA